MTAIASYLVQVGTLLQGWPLWAEVGLIGGVELRPRRPRPRQQGDILGQAGGDQRSAARLAAK
jgi:hypothetical protein